MEYYFSDCYFKCGRKVPQQGKKIVIKSCDVCKNEVYKEYKKIEREYKRFLMDDI
jgi:hypothetical protein